MIKVSHKYLKVVLVLGVKKLGPIFLVSNLDNFLFFKILLDLTIFSNFDNYPDLLASFSLLLLISNLITLLLFLFFFEMICQVI